MIILHQTRVKSIRLIHFKGFNEDNIYLFCSCYNYRYNLSYIYLVQYVAFIRRDFPKSGVCILIDNAHACKGRSEKTKAHFFKKTSIVALAAIRIGFIMACRLCVTARAGALKRTFAVMQSSTSHHWGFM